MARKIATEFPGSGDMQQRMIEQINSEQNTAAEMLAHINDVHAMVAKSRDPQERFNTLIFFGALVANADRKEGLKLIDQAAGMIETLKPGKGPAQLSNRTGVHL
jgi:hypothetical protein